MPELAAATPSVILCAASPEALDRLVPPGHGARPVRTAPDEVLFVAGNDVGPDVLREVADRIVVLDPDALALDVTEGRAAWMLRGSDARDAFLRVSMLELPTEGALQGEVAHLAATVLVGGDGDEVLVLVAASAGEHLRTRLLHDARATEAPS